MKWLMALALIWSTTVSAAEMKSLDEFSLADYQGKVVYLDFWASWCGPCRKSFPWMNDMVDKYGEQGFEIIAVSVDEDPRDAVAFLDEYPANFTIVSDPQGTLAQRYEIIGMPTSFLFSREGELRFSHKGFRRQDPAKLETAIAEVLGDSSE